MTTVIFQRYSSPQISFEGVPLEDQEIKCWYYKLKRKTFGPFLTKKDAEVDLQIRIMECKN